MHDRFVVLIAAVLVDSYFPRSGDPYSREPGLRKFKAKRLSSLKPKFQFASPVSINNFPQVKICVVGRVTCCFHKLKT